MPLAFTQEGFVITACIQRMGEGTVFSLFVSPHLDRGGGGYPSQVWMVGGTSVRSGWWGSTLARSGWWGGVPQPGLEGGGYPSQVWMVGGTPQPGLDSGGYPGQVLMVGGVPQPGLDGGGYLGYPLARSRW